MPAVKQKLSKDQLKQKLLDTVLPLVAVIALVLAGYFYFQMREMKQSPETILARETSDLVAKVSQLMVLPEGETPTVATISDPGVLKDQPFFVQAQKGDKVLIYTQAKKAILYSVALDKILDIAPLNLGAQKP